MFYGYESRAEAEKDWNLSNIQPTVKNITVMPFEYDSFGNKTRGSSKEGFIYGSGENTRYYPGIVRSIYTYHINNNSISFVEQ